MTTTSLYISNMTGAGSVQTIKQLLNKAGFMALSISIGKVRVSRQRLSTEDILNIKHGLSRKGYKLLSVSETTWPDHHVNESNPTQLK